MALASTPSIITLFQPASKYKGYSRFSRIKLKRHVRMHLAVMKRAKTSGGEGPGCVYSLGPVYAGIFPLNLGPK